jgi:glycosyltransferase involved in cell wall biosynthesis
MGKSDAMQVLMVMTARTVGGAEIFAEGLVSALGDSCRFTIALADHPDMHDLARRLGKRARVLTFPFDRTSRLPGVARRLQQLAAGFDVIHLNSNHPGSRLGILMGYVLPRGGRPVVCVEQGATPMSAIEVPRAIAWSLPTLFRWSRHSVAQIVAVSEENRDTLVNRYRIPAQKITVVRNGVDLRSFAEPAPGTLRQELGLAPDQPVLIVLGRLAPNKGQQYLVDAAPAILAQFPTAHFVFAGNPDGRAHLDERIRAAGLEDTFSLIGFRSDVANILRSSDLFVLPSLAEGLSLAIIEALAAGLPVVATRVGGAAEIIEEGRNGFLVPPADAGALACAVNRVLSLDAVARSRLRQSALESAQPFSIDATANRMLGIYRQLAGSTS